MSKRDENDNNRGDYSRGDLFGMAIILGTAIGVGVGAFLLRDQTPPKKPAPRTPPIEVEDRAGVTGEDVSRVGERIN